MKFWPKINVNPKNQFTFASSYYYSNTFNQNKSTYFFVFSENIEK